MKHRLFVSIIGPLRRLTGLFIAILAVVTALVLLAGIGPTYLSDKFDVGVLAAVLAGLGWSLPYSNMLVFMRLVGRFNRPLVSRSTAGDGYVDHMASHSWAPFRMHAVAATVARDRMDTYPRWLRVYASLSRMLNWVYVAVVVAFVGGHLLGIIRPPS